MAFLRQVWTLTVKNLLLIFVRPWFTTIIRAFIAPIIFMFFISYSKNFFIPPANFGVGSPSALLSFRDALVQSGGDRQVVAFVNNGFTGGAIQQVIQELSTTIEGTGKRIEIAQSDTDLLTICRSTLRGVSPCYGVASFISSPNEGQGGLWNYTLRADGAFGTSVYVDRSNNDAQIYILPFQHAIDSAIARSSGASIPDRIDQYIYTSRTTEERAQNIQRLFMNSLINIFGLAFFVGMCNVNYQLTGHMATERERGISQLIDAMVPSQKTWHTQAARLIAEHLAFDIVHIPGYIIMGAILARIAFPSSNAAISILYHLLIGLSLVSYSIFGGSLFRKAQLSGITVVLVSVILAIIAQVTKVNGTAAVAILSLLFPPMNYVFFIIYQARWERHSQGVDLARVAPESPWQLPGYVFWILAVVQIFVFPLLAAFVERWLYGTADPRRDLTMSSDSTNAVELSSFSKHYEPSALRKWMAKIFRVRLPETVIAVNELSISVKRGQILALLGANGSGKSTTLNAITGLSTFNGGSIKVDGAGGLGYCPQKNVMWDQLTVFEHVRIFNKLKSTGALDEKATLEQLIQSCDLGHKINAKSKTLSGGQKRKLQLAMMFTGGSRVCAIDEISSGLDPVSRRKIWDILLAERGSRSMLLTTHFLDEADVLADQMAILSKGHLKADGSSAELKHRLGGGYRIYIPAAARLNEHDLRSDTPQVTKRRVGDRYVYQMPASGDAARFVERLERQQFTDYQVTGPSIEDVFLKLAEEIQESFGAQDASAVIPGQTIEETVQGSKVSSKSANSVEVDTSDLDAKPEDTEKSHLDMTHGEGLGIAAQTWVLFRKRITILKRNFLPYLVALLIPIIAAGLVTLFLRGFNGLSCDPGANSNQPQTVNFAVAANNPQLNSTTRIPVGPANGVNTTDLARLTGLNETTFTIVNTLQELEDYVAANFAVIKPGGFFLGDVPTYAFEGDAEIFYSVLTQNVVNNLLSGTQISTNYQTLAVPFSPTAGDTLQLILYFSLAMCAYIGFFALYPTQERLRNVRALHYSNGIRAAPLWFAYLLFDTIFALIVSAITTGILVGASSVWYGPGYMFVCFFLYSFCSILVSYIVSLFASSSLAAFAVTAGMNCSLLLLYFVIVLVMVTYANPVYLTNNLTIASFTWPLIAPSASLLQSLFLGLNQFSLLCRDSTERISYPGSIVAYGQPITYLVIQSILCLTFLIWWDSGSRLSFSFLKKSSNDSKDPESDSSLDAKDPSVVKEAERIDSLGAHPLKVQHVHKSFGRDMIAVEDVSFGIAESEVFALLGPNGAGKSTTISLIRGDLEPSYKNSDILVENISIIKNRAKARLSLGVCPQFDAMDTMTVLEHLNFYARVRGVPSSEIKRNIDTVIHAVGLTPYTGRMAAKLSGGNKRKLSLAIAMMGNPSVLLLDEPSSGMDAAAKRVMWKTLSAVSHGRSLLITTHSMEEADALATRAGIMARRMLAVGTTDELRERYGGGWYVHLVLFDAAQASDEAHTRVAEWLTERIPGARIQGKMMHGQVRARIEGEKTGAAGLFEVLEKEGREMGVEYYSIGRGTLDQVFLEIIGPRDDE